MKFCMNLKENKGITYGTLIICIVLFLIGLMVGIATMYYFNNKDKEEAPSVNIEKLKEDIIELDDDNIEPEKDLEIDSASKGIEVVPTMSDKLSNNTVWCATFQLVWNDMKNEIVKKDIVFKPQLEMVKNLNKEEFTQDMLSDEYYFKIYGLKTLELKEKIKKGIKDKFNQESDILEDFDWSEDGLDNPNNINEKRYFLYVMLYRKFTFMNDFGKLDNQIFANKYENIKYFGINSTSENSARSQIDVLYYNSKDDFAVILNTKENDEVILCKNPAGSNFNEIYENMKEKESKYTGKKEFGKKDELKVPYLEFNEKREYSELANQKFEAADGNEAEILKAIQTVKFSLNEHGGEIKSEAAIDMKLTNAMIEEPNLEEPRYFYVDDTFAIFLKEKGKDKPYFASKINDITKFQ